MKLSNSRLIKFTFELREAYIKNINGDFVLLTDLFKPTISSCYPSWTPSFVNQCYVDYMTEIAAIYNNSKYQQYNLDRQTIPQEYLFPFGNIPIRVEFLTYCLNYFLDLRTDVLMQDVSSYLEELNNNIIDLNERLARLESETP